MWGLCGALILLGLFGQSVSQCPDSWINFQGHCYLFAHDEKTFTDAENFCLQRGAHLAHVDNEIESLFLRNTCRDLVRKVHWIGLTDVDVEGIWRWKHTGQQAGYTDWYPGEPNGASTQNCVTLYPGNDYRWEDLSCADMAMPICQKEFSCGETVIG